MSGGNDLAGAHSLGGTWSVLVSSSTRTTGWNVALIPWIQDIKVFEPVFEEPAVSSQTRNTGFESPSTVSALQ